MVTPRRLLSLTLLTHVLMLRANASHATEEEGEEGEEGLPMGVIGATEDRIFRVDSFVLPGQPLQRSVQNALDAAVASCLSGSSTALLFSPKQYRLASPNATAHLPVLNISNLEGDKARPLRIDGCGAHIVVTTPLASLFSVVAANSLRIGNLSVDYDPLPMTQGRVVRTRSPLHYTLQIECVTLTLTAVAKLLR